MSFCGSPGYQTVTFRKKRIKSVQGRDGKAFPDKRQHERRIKFIREGDVVRTAGWLKGELNLFADW